MRKYSNLAPRRICLAKLFKSGCENHASSHCLFNFCVTLVFSSSAPAAACPLPASLWGFSLWGNKELDSPAWKLKNWKIFGENWLKMLQMVQFKCPRHWNTSDWLRLGEFHFLIFNLPLSGVIRIGPPAWMLKSWKILGTKSVQQA